MGSGELVIPDYTLDEYKQSDAPYAWLYEHRNNKFMLKRLTQILKEKAGSLGFKGFVGMFNAYCETMATRDGIPTDRVTDFDGQPFQLVSGEYICTDSGVAILDKFGYEVAVCPHPIMPIRRLVNVDSGEERLEIAYRKGSIWRTAIVEKSVLASSQKILDLAAYGVIVTSENAKLLSTYLFKMEQLNYQILSEKRSVGRLGWIHDNGFSPYLDELEFDGEVNFRHIFQAVGQKGDREKWIEAIKKVRAERTVGRLFLAASFASAILEPCGLLPFFVHAWGGSGTGKTVSLMIAASVWANPRMGEYITTFNSTDVGQEMVASFLNSLPMCLDELQIQASSGVKEFDRMIYKLTEGIGKTRGAKSGGIRQLTTWKNCILTTGEYPIINANSMSGATIRVIEVECDKKVYSDLIGLCAVLNENYGFAGQEFVRYLQQDGVQEEVSAMQKELFRELLQKDGTDKQALSASALIAADRIATQLFFNDGNELTVDDLAEYLVRVDMANANVRALEYIYELVSRNPMRFAPGENGEYRGEVWGKIEEPWIYITKSVFDREMSNAGFNSSAFLSWAKRQSDLIRFDSDRNGRSTKKTRIAGGIVNCVCIHVADDQSIRLDDLEDIGEEIPPF